MTTTTTKTSTYIVKTASAKARKWGRHGRVAVLEIEAGLVDVSMISSRAKGVVQVVQIWEDLNMGSSNRCAYALALAEATTLCAKLNAA